MKRYNSGNSSYRSTYDFNNLSIGGVNNAALQALYSSSSNWWVVAGFLSFGAFFTPFSAIFTIGFVFGLIKKLRDKRLKDMAMRYYELMITRESWSAQEIAFFMNCSVAQVKMDLQTLFDKKILILKDSPQPAKTAFGCPGDDYTNSYYSYNSTQKTLKSYQKPEEKAAEPVSPPKAEDKEAGELFGEANEYIRQMRLADERIDGDIMSENIKKIESVTLDICKACENNPDAVKKTRRFMQYYLPTTVKLLNTYVRMEETNVQTDNIKKIKNDIEQSLETVVKAFHRLYDSLYDFDAIDITSEIEAFKGALATDGLIEESLSIDMAELENAKKQD